MIDITMPLAAVRVALAILLMAGVVHKLRDMTALRGAIASYLRDTPFQGAQLIATLAAAITAAEAVTALAIAASWVAPFTVFGAVLGAALFMFYAAVMAYNIARGNRIADCGCSFGGQQKQTVGWPLVLRNVLLALLAASVAIPARPSALDWMGVVGFAALLLLMYAIWNELHANRVVTGEQH